MNNKKMIIAASSLVLATALIAGGTYAYFTDQETIENIVTFGNVNISLTEPNYIEKGGNAKAVNIIPGNTVVKDPTIKNTGDNSCFIRVKVDVTESYVDPKDTTPPAVEVEDITNLSANADWIKSGDYYYYQKALAPTETVVLFQELTIPTTWGNSYADLKLDIDVIAEAIQSQNFNPRNNDGKILAWDNITVPAV